MIMNDEFDAMLNDIKSKFQILSVSYILRQCIY